jgi:HEAT repeat protein
MNMNRTALLRTSLSAAFFVGCLCLTPGAPFVKTTSADAGQVEKFNRFVQASNSNDSAMNLFREARELIENENWKQAEKKFQTFIRDYPKHENVDAAMYWRAFSLKKLGQLREADEAAQKLIESNPNSRWTEDARALRAEVAPGLGNTEVINQGLEDDNDNDTKQIALQSLFQSSPQRGTEVAIELLKSPKTGKQLKRTAVSMIGIYGGPSGRAALLDIARNRNNEELQKTAVFWLGQGNDEDSVKTLIDLYGSSSDEALKKQILFSISQNGSSLARTKLVEVARSGSDVALRKQAIFGLSQNGRDGGFDELSELFDSERDDEVRDQILFAMSQSHNKKSYAKLLEIVRGSSSVEIRKKAIFWLGQGRGSSTAPLLIELYDGEKALDLKQQLIFSLSQCSDKAALRKLMKIANEDSSMELRRKAVFWLGQSRDPEAAKFLEGFLK